MSRLPSQFLMAALSCCLTVAALAEPESGAVLTLEGAIALTRQRNYDVRLMEQELRGAEGRITEAKSSILPRLSGELDGRRRSDPQVPGGEETNESYSAKLVFRQALYRPAAVALLKASRSSAQAVSAEAQTVELAANNTTCQLFYDMLLAEENVRVSEEAVSLAEHHLQDVQKRADRGLARKLEVIRAQVDLSREQAQLIAERNTRLLIGSQLLNHLGMSTEQPLRIVGELRDVKTGERADEALAEALSSRPEVAQLLHESSMQDQRIVAARKGRWPEIDLVGEEGDNYPNLAGDSTDEESWFVGLKVSIPLFNGYETRGRVTQEEARRDQLQVLRDRLLSAVQLEITQALLNLSTAEQLVAARAQALQQADEAVRLANVGYTQGVNTQLDVLDARIDYTQASRARAQAIRDHLVANADFQRSTGRLLTVPSPIINDEDTQP